MVKWQRGGEGKVDHRGSERIDLGVVQGGEGLGWDSQACLALWLWGGENQHIVRLYAVLQASSPK